MNDKLKFGQRRTEPKRYYLKRSKINQKSKKRIKEEPEYNRLSQELKEKAGFKSELPNHAVPSTFDWLETHHITGRDGSNYTNPFKLIVILFSEHQGSNESIHKHNTPEKKQELLDYIYPIRIAQGYKPEDYQ